MADAFSELLPVEAALEVRDACLCWHAQRAARALARRFDEALRPFGLTNEQYSLLMTLRAAGSPSVGQLAAWVGADRTTLTAALKPLVRQGLAVISRDADDHRVRKVGLTDQGRERLARALPAWRAVQDELEGRLSPAGAERVRTDLKALAEPPQADLKEDA